MERQAKVSWGGPGTPFVIEISPLAAGQLALMIETPEIQKAIQEHARAYAGVSEIHDGISEALGDYGRNFWEAKTDDLFPMKDLPQQRRTIGRVDMGPYQGRGFLLGGSQ